MGTSAARAVANARYHVVTRQVPQGMCLNWVWRMFGSQPSTGYAAGTLSSAMTAWNGSQQQHGPAEPPPIGAPVYFGVSPTRTDRNRDAGDVTIHVGDGILACTDAVGANTGFMTIPARAKQTQRPYIGWAGDFGGRTIDFGVTIIPTTDGQPVIIQQKEGSDMIAIRDRDTGHTFALGEGRVQHLGDEGDGQKFANYATVNDELQQPSHADTLFLFRAYGVPEQYTDAELLRREQPDGHWSADKEFRDTLARIENAQK